MPTDIDRLHKAIDNLNTWSSRRSGKTTVMIHKLAGQVQVGDYRDIYVTMVHYRDLQWLRPKIKEVFIEQDIEIIKTSAKELVVCYNGNETILSFVSLDDFDHGRAMRGVDGVKVDLVDYADQSYRSKYEEIKERSDENRARNWGVFG